jgi:hypothetical protein
MNDAEIIASWSGKSGIIGYLLDVAQDRIWPNNEVRIESWEKIR